MATNEREIMPTLLDVHGLLIWCIETLAKEFGRVFVPCVTGNHGRNTHKIRAKGRNFTNFDWRSTSSSRSTSRMTRGYRSPSPTAQIASIGSTTTPTCSPTATSSGGAMASSAASARL